MKLFSKSDKKKISSVDKHMPEWGGTIVESAEAPSLLNTLAIEYGEEKATEMIDELVNLTLDYLAEENQATSPVKQALKQTKLDSNVNF